MNLTARRKQLSELLGYVPSYIGPLVKRLGLSEDAPDSEIQSAARAYLKTREAAHGGASMLITINGETRSRKSWSRKVNVHYSTLRWRVAYAMKMDASLSAEKAWEQIISDTLRGIDDQSKSRRRAKGRSASGRVVSVDGQSLTIGDWARKLGTAARYLSAAITYAAVDGRSAEDVIRSRIERSLSDAE